MTPSRYTVIFSAFAIALSALAAAPAASASGQLPHSAVVKKVTSLRWAGYAALADRRKDIRYVAADFTVPSLDVCNGQDQPGGVSSTQWIGLGAYNGGIPMRIGVVEACDFMTNEIFTWGFYSSPGKGIKSGPGIFLACGAGPPCPISPGDRIQLSVYYNGKTNRLILSDVTKGTSKRFYELCSKCGKSAEVISAASSTATNPPLSLLSNVSFFGVRVTSADGKRGTMAPQPGYWATVEITRLDSAGNTVGKPYPLRRHGRAFTVFSYAFTGP